MAGMKHNVPGEFNNETKWLRLFSNRQLCYLGVAFLVTALCYKVSVALVGAALPGVITGLVIGVCIMFPVMRVIPETEFLKGGGLFISTLLVRLWIRKRNRRIYVKGWGKE